jgi:hypothetical protein
MLVALRIFPSAGFIPEAFGQFQMISGIRTPNRVQPTTLEGSLEAENRPAVGLGILTPLQQA